MGRGDGRRKKGVERERDKHLPLEILEQSG
jgi:hypothetical protein